MRVSFNKVYSIIYEPIKILTGLSATTFVERCPLCLGDDDLTLEFLEDERPFYFLKFSI